MAKFDWFTLPDGDGFWVRPETREMIEAEIHDLQLLIEAIGREADFGWGTSGANDALKRIQILAAKGQPAERVHMTPEELAIEADLDLDLRLFGSCFWRVVDGKKVRVPPDGVRIRDDGSLLGADAMVTRASAGKSGE